MERCTTRRILEAIGPIAPCLLALALALVACTSLPGQHFPMASFGRSAGLANLNATVLLEDRGGHVWVGTENGVYLADGRRFLKQAGFADAGLEQIDALREDGRGRVWALDHRHLVFWDGAAIHAVDGLNLRKTSGEARDLIALRDEPDAVFLLAGGELLRVASHDDGRSWTALPAIRPELLATHPELKQLNSLNVDGDSAVWMGCGSMLCRLDLRAGTVEDFGVAQGVPGGAWKAVLRSRGGTVWARTAEQLIRLRGRSGRFERGPRCHPEQTSACCRPGSRKTWTIASS